MTMSGEAGRADQERDREPWWQRDRPRRVTMPLMALVGLVGPPMLVGAIILGAMYYASDVASEPRGIEVDDCQRAVMCCTALQGQGAAACAPILAMAGESSGVPTSNRQPLHNVRQQCRVQLRQLSVTAQSRDLTLPACHVTAK